MRLFLARHGETVENAMGISQGHMPGHLSERGLRQARRLALRLKSERIDAIYSSDLKRAVDTAEEVAKFHPEAETIFTKSLREVDLKNLTGTKLDWGKGRPSGIETPESMAGRARKALEAAFSAYQNGTVLFVGHVGIDKYILRLLHGWPLDKNIPAAKNASLQEFEIGKKNGQFRVLE